MFKSLFNFISLRHQFTFRGRGWVITKKYPANAPEMKKFSKLAKSRMFTTKVRSEWENSSRLHHRTHPLCKVIGLFRSSNLQVAISRVRISVLREELKEKSSRHLCSLKLMMCFLIGPGRTDMCSFYIYTSQYLREFFFHIKVLSVFFGEIPRTANNSFNLYRYLFFNLHKMCGTCSGVVLCIH